MKLSISNIAWKAENDQIVYDLMTKTGFTGLEIAPTRIFPTAPYDQLEQAEVWSRELKVQYGFTIPSMQSIWFGRSENLFGTQEERQTLVDYTKKAIDFAARIGCHNLVFGCPKNRNIPEGANAETAVSFFKEIGDYAKERGTVIGMEANPPIYNTNYINDTLSALMLVKQVDSEGFLLNLDVGTMIQNKEDMNELIGNVRYINHVHISEPGLKPVEMRQLHSDLKDILEKEGYQGYISIEMGKTDNVGMLAEKLSYVSNVFR